MYRMRYALAAMLVIALLAGVVMMVIWSRMDSEEMLNLGMKHDYGLGVPENDVEAVRWYRMAAEQGHADAQYSLWEMYADGLGVPQDSVVAYMWHDIAATNGNDLATKNRNIVAGIMTPAQVSEAERLSRECLESNYRDCP